MILEELHFVIPGHNAGQNAFTILEQFGVWRILVKQTFVLRPSSEHILEQPAVEQCFRYILFVDGFHFALRIPTPQALASKGV